MRAKYAAAIRDGIKSARETDFGALDDPFYKLRSRLIWGYNGKEKEVALAAFRREHQKLMDERTAGLSHAEVRELDENFHHVWILWNETPQERRERELRGEVADLKLRLRELESHFQD